MADKPTDEHPPVAATGPALRGGAADDQADPRFARTPHRRQEAPRQGQGSAPGEAGIRLTSAGGFN